jgi:hypothetical protein
MKCLLQWPRVFDCISRLENVVGGYYNAYKVWHLIGTNHRAVGADVGFSKRFSFEELLIYLEFRHHDTIIWGKIQNAEDLFLGGQYFSLEEVNPVITCKLDSIADDFSLRIVFFLKHQNSSPIFISIRHLSIAMHSISFEHSLENAILRSIAIEDNFTLSETKFLGIVRFRILEYQPKELRDANQLQEFTFGLSLFGFMTYLMTPRQNVRRTGQNLKPRHLLTFLKKTLRWVSYSL